MQIPAKQQQLPKKWSLVERWSWGGFSSKGEAHPLLLAIGVGDL